MKRAFDIAAAACALIVLAPVLAVIAVIVRLETPGPAIHWSRRAGRNGALFAMPKFRTMRIETPDVATHMLENPAQWVTPAGRVLRKTSLDELPQLWPILIGAMSFVGPRPALHNQQDLIALRAEAGVFLSSGDLKKDRGLTTRDHSYCAAPGAHTSSLLSLSLSNSNH